MYISTFIHQVLYLVKEIFKKFGNFDNFDNLHRSNGFDFYNI